MIREELSKKSARLIDDYINGRQQLSELAYDKLKGELNVCIQELQDLTWNLTCDPSQYNKLVKRLKEYENLEKTMKRVHRFHKELNGDNNRKEFYKVGTQDYEELPIMKMKLIKVTKKDANVLAEKKFGEVNVFIKEYNGKVYADFIVPVAGSSGYLDSVKQGLVEMKKRVKEVESAISWAEAEIKKQR